MRLTISGPIPYYCFGQQTRSVTTYGQEVALPNTNQGHVHRRNTMKKLVAALIITAGLGIATAQIPPFKNTATGAAMVLASDLDGTLGCLKPVEEYLADSMGYCYTLDWTSVETHRNLIDVTMRTYSDVRWNGAWFRDSSGSNDAYGRSFYIGDELFMIIVMRDASTGTGSIAGIISEDYL